MPTVVAPLRWTTLTANVREIRAMYSFVFDTFFSQRQAITTEEVEIGKWFRGRPMAPFVKIGDMPHPVSVRTSQFEKIACPYIALDTPVNPDDLMNDRLPGTPIFIPPSGGGVQMPEIQRRINDKLVDQVDMITGRTEWMCCKLLETAAMTYSVGESPEVAEAITIDFNRDAALSVTLAGAAKWTDAASKPWDDILAARKLVAKKSGLRVNMAIVGDKTANAMRNHAELLKRMDQKKVDIGRMDFESQFGGEEGGPIFVCQVAGVRFFEYDVQMEELDGSSVSMLSANACIFVARGGNHGRRVYYGAIPDLKLLRNRRLKSNRFSKYYETDEPSVGHIVTKSRPMPVLRRPDGIYSLFPVDP